MTEPLISNYPSPPDNLKLPIVEVESGHYFYRLNRRQDENGQIYPSARFFDRTGYGRWDGLQQGYGILYVGDDFYATYVDCHGRDPGCFSTTETELESRFLARFVSDRPLRFVQVYGNGLQKLGVDAGITSCPPRDYEFPRKWGRAFHQHPDRVDGICYLSRHDNTRLCYGIFDRVTAEISEEQLWHGSFQPLAENSLTDDSGRSLTLPSNRQHPKIDLDRVLQHYDYELIRTTILETDRDVIE